MLMKNTLKIDVHTHSSYSSDGEISPSALIERCSEQGIMLTALCDHNTVAGVEEASRAAARNQIAFIPAIEISCQTIDGTEIHLISYGASRAAAEFERIGEMVNRAEETSNLARLGVLEVLGFQIDRKELERIQAGRLLVVEMIAETILSNPANRNHPLLQPYLAGGAKSDQPLINFYWDMCTFGKPAYVPVVYPALKEVVSVIRDFGGIGVVAHPGKSIPRDKADRIVREMIRDGISGFEAYSSYHTDSMTDYYLNAAETFKSGITVGSDFHGAIKPTIEVGSVSCGEDCRRIFKFLEPYIR